MAGRTRGWALVLLAWMVAEMTTQETSSGSSTPQVTSGPSTTPQVTSGPSTPQVTSSGPSTTPQVTSGPSTPQVTSSGPSTPQVTSTSLTTTQPNSTVPTTNGTQTTSITPTTTQVTTTTTQTTSMAPTTTQLTSMAPTIASYPAVICQNGGTYDGIKCLCTAAFYGPYCEFATDSIGTNLPYPGTIVADLQVVVTVTNFNFTEELKDTASAAYRQFEEHFRKEIKKIYGHIPGYEGVKIISLKAGSVVVDHEVTFSMKESSNQNQTFEETTKRLVEKLREVEATQGACQHDNSTLCLTVAANPIVKNMAEVPSLDDICWQRAPSEYRDSYYAVVMDGVIHCVTNCTLNLKTTMDCHHGQCHVTRAGPQCFCQDEALYWYTKPQCAGRVSKLATGLGLVATVLLVVCVVLVALLVRDRRRKYLLSDSQSDIRGNWYEDSASAWRSPDGFVYHNADAEATTGGDPLRNFTPTLELVDTSSPMKISRPKLTTQL